MSSVSVIGTKQGCFTIIDGFEAYQEEVLNDQIAKLEEDKQRFMNGEKVDTNNIDSVDGYDFVLQEYRSYSYQRYKCQCKCGNIHFISADWLYRKKWRDCEPFGGKNGKCTLKQNRIKKREDSYPRIKVGDYDVDYSNTLHETLEILECIDDNHVEGPYIYDKRKKNGGRFTIYKLYRCRCYLCGKEHKYKSSDFKIKKDYYGYRAKDGYYCKAFCDCHPISSFQWRTIKILREHHVAHKAEFSFQDLYGTKQKKLLRYDFAILDSDDNVKCLIECQGEQHTRPIDEYGGLEGYESQVMNDELKRAYAKSHNIPLFEIPYTCNTYEKEIEFLKTAGII